MRDDNRSLRREIQLLRFDIDKLQAALEPFARAGALVPPNTLDESALTVRWTLPDDTPIITLGNAPGPYYTLTYGHLRTAAEAMEGQSNGK